VATKRFKELKSLSKDELAAKIRESEVQLFQIKMKKSTGQLENTAMIWRLRKDIARMKMLGTQMESAAGQKSEKVAR
jgi:large subunit ribosomal protein L29